MYEMISISPQTAYLPEFCTRTSAEALLLLLLLFMASTERVAHKIRTRHFFFLLTLVTVDIQLTLLLRSL